MQTMFDAATYTQRRAALMARMQRGLLLFPGNLDSPMNYAGNLYPFWQDRTFLYYFGLNEPGLAAVIDVEAGRAILFGDDATVDDVMWTGPVPPLAEQARAVGVTETAPAAGLETVVQEALRQKRPVHFLSPYRMDLALKMEAWLGIRASRLRDHASKPLIQAVVAQRSVKSADEVAEIEQAIGISRDMYALAMQRIRPGVVEREVVGAIEACATAQGSTISFPIIFSIRGETLHNHRHNNRMQAGDLALLDSGVTSPRGYASDLTRTFPVNGRFTDRQRAVYQTVLDAQEAAIAALRPGVQYRDVHLTASRVLAEGLKTLGLLKGDVDEAVAAGAHAICFPHGLGHMMGLDVHDMENLGEDYVGYTPDMSRSTQFGLAHLRLAKALEPGYVVTVEPGLYFIPALIDQWQAEGRHADFINYAAFEAFRGFGGVRIEDDVLVTTDGYRVLGPPVSKTVADVEAGMQG
jgi:Xaa-Pro aminopeptidase